MKNWVLWALVGHLFLLPVHAADLSLQFQHLWNDEPVRIGKPLKHSDGSTITFSRISYLLSNPALLTANGNKLSRKDWFGFVEVSEADSMIHLIGLPDSQITDIHFSVGLDEKTNLSDPNQYPPKHPLNPLLNNLHWSWQGGYIFLAMEGTWEKPETPSSGFLYHIGNAVHRMEVKLPIKLDLTKPQKLELHFHMDQVLGSLVNTKTNSSHGRKGDPVAVQIKKSVQQAFAVGNITQQANPSIPIKQITQKKAGIGTPYPFKIKRGFPIPALPEDFPLTKERVQLGKRLFHDPNLSSSNEVSCATCHLKDHAFAEPKHVSTGLDGGVGFRNSMPLHNMAWKKKFFWDGRATRLRDQALEAIESPGEMAANLDTITQYLEHHTEYPSLFKAAFGPKPITPENLTVAIEQFVLSLTSMDSKFDRAQRGQTQLNPQEQRGFELFFTEYDPRRQLYGADCFHCHGGAFFTDFQFHHTGLPYTDGQKFATPSLRNLTLTAPYMHDGRFQTLEQVLNHYTSGIQRSQNLAPSLAKHRSNGIPLSEADQKAIIAFLMTLADPQFDGLNQ